MRLYLVRHGEAEGNAERRYIGWEERSLTDTGKDQAHALAQSLSGELITAIHSSDLSRAKETAAAIAQLHHLPVRYDKDLREINFGAWSGLTYEEIACTHADHLRAWIGNPEQHTPPGGESLPALRERALRAIPRQDGVLIVSHGGTIRAVLSYLTGDPFWAIQVPLGRAIIVEWEGTFVRVTQHRCGTDAEVQLSPHSSR